MRLPTSSPSKGADVQELERELSNIRSAFEEYIKSSKELEDGLDFELADMSKYSKE
jgi:phage shock protein A